jgi:uncharacterized protein with ParB-like and HNH nuclease domain
MNPVKIEANQYPLHKVFGNDFVFTIPLYQRPYAWEKEQASELLDDLITALGDSSEAIEEINPYFLGTVVLIKEDKPDAQVVDGQQRLTTLTILLAALRSSLSIKEQHKLSKYLYQEADFLEVSHSAYRLNLRERDREFFKKYIQDECDVLKLKELSDAKLTDSCLKIKENALLFVDKLQELPESQRLRLASFILTRCFIVVVSTPDIESSYRIFSVINNRGLDLSHADIIKAEIIGVIPVDKQDKYSKKWEEIEENLGQEDFKSLFSHIRMIHDKNKPREGILKEFYKCVKPSPTEYPQEFIDEILIPLADAFDNIKKKSYESTHFAKKVNQSFSWLGMIDNSDWIPAAILYLSTYYSKPELLVKFFTDLDRLTSGLMILRANNNERVERYSLLLKAIETGEDLYLPDSPLQLNESEKTKILQTLGSDLYSIRKIRLYVLLRLDAFLSEAEVVYFFPNITVEHVLPQNPASESEWLKNFPNQEERNKYVHRLGNLVLLSRYKNSSAQNYDFEVKKTKYFITKTGISPFALTTQVLTHSKWTPEVIEQRQQHLIDKLKQLWRLDNK